MASLADISDNNIQKLWHLYPLSYEINPLHAILCTPLFMNILCQCMWPTFYMSCSRYSLEQGRKYQFWSTIQFVSYTKRRNNGWNTQHQKDFTNGWILFSLLYLYINPRGSIWPILSYNANSQDNKRVWHLKFVHCAKTMCTWIPNAE